MRNSQTTDFRPENKVIVNRKIDGLTGGSLLGKELELVIHTETQDYWTAKDEFGRTKIVPERIFDLVKTS